MAANNMKPKWPPTIFFNIENISSSYFQPDFQILQICLKNYRFEPAWDIPSLKESLGQIGNSQKKGES